MLLIAISPHYCTLNNFSFNNKHCFRERFLEKQYTVFLLSANPFVSADAFFKVYPYIILERESPSPRRNISILLLLSLGS